MYTFINGIAVSLIILQLHFPVIQLSFHHGKKATHISFFLTYFYYYSKYPNNNNKI